MSEFDAFRDQWGESRFDPKKHRHRLNKNKHKQRMPVKPPPEPEEGEDESEPKYGRRPSSALVCCARYRERYLTKPEPEPEPEPPLVIPKDVLSPRQVRIYLAKIRRMLAKPPIAKSRLDVAEQV